MSAEEYERRLKYYLEKIERLSKSSERILSSLTENYLDEQNYSIFQAQALAWAQSQGRSEREQLAYTRYLNMSTYLQRAKTNLQFEKELKKMELTMKQTYRLIDDLRYEMTGERTTFRVAVDVGGVKRGRLYEVDLPLEEVLSVAKASPAWGAAGIKQSLMLRLNASAKQKANWVKNYSATDITESYKDFIEYYGKGGQNLLSGLNTGRKFELYRLSKLYTQGNRDAYNPDQLSFMDDPYSGSSSIRLDTSVLSQLKHQVLSDNVSFVRGVDSAYSLGGVQYFESLKSFIGGNPGLANFNTLFETLEQLKTVVSGYFDNPQAIQKQLEEQLAKQNFEQQMSMDMGFMVQEQVIPQQVTSLMQDIFPAAIMSGSF